MKTYDELIDARDPGWPIVEQWIASARNRVDVLPVDAARARDVLVWLQVTTRSPMGAIAHATGGLVIDDWIRILGGGGPRMRANLASWNGLGDAPIAPTLPGKLVIAHDLGGGVFALDAATRTVAYFAPDELAWEDLELGYSDFLGAMLTSDLDEFAGELRWNGWRAIAATTSLDHGISAWPPPWTLEGRGGAVSRKAVPMTELCSLQFEMARQL